MRDETWLVAVTAGRWQHHGIRAARAAGLKVLAIDSDPHAEGFADSDAVLNIALDDHEAVVEAISGMAKTVRGAVSFVSEVGMLLAARIREAFDLPGPRSALTMQLIDKGLQRETWTRAGVPGPAWRVFHDPAEALAALADVGYPLIVKPTDSSGSRGVTRIESPTEDVQAAVARAFQFSRSGAVIVEACMEGTEFTAEVFAADGEVHVLAVTEKKKVDGTRGTVARELATPGRAPEVVARIADTVVAAYRALGYREGPGHAEVILKADESIGVVEAAGRGGGFMVFDRFVPLVSGVDIARLTALQAVGLPVGQIASAGRAAVLRFFPSRPGTLERVSGFDAANRLEGVIAEPFAHPGDRFGHAAVDGDRLGYVLTCAATPAQAQALADSAERLIQFEFREAS